MRITTQLLLTQELGPKWIDYSCNCLGIRAIESQSHEVHLAMY
jgi:hypothetical protein